MNSVTFRDREIFLPAVPVSSNRKERVPELGEDTVDILSSLGFSTVEITKISGK